VSSSSGEAGLLTKGEPLYRVYLLTFTYNLSTADYMQTLADNIIIMQRNRLRMQGYVFRKDNMDIV